MASPRSERRLGCAVLARPRALPAAQEGMGAILRSLARIRADFPPPGRRARLPRRFPVMRGPCGARITTRFARYKPRLWRGRSGCTPGAERFRLTPGMDCGRCAVYGLVFAGLPARAAPGFRGEPTYGGAFRAAALQTAAHHVLIHKHM